MKDFDWTQFTRKIPIKASVESLYNAWAIPNELEKWFLKDASFQNENGSKIDKKLPVLTDQIYTWKWHLWDGTETGEITKANGKDHFQFSFAGSCSVDVIFEPYKKGTIIHLTQKNIPTDDASKKNIRIGCDRGWSFYLVNLKSVYEGGLDLRNKDTSLLEMLNS